jgi:type IV pilus assembly protein PilM
MRKQRERTQLNKFIRMWISGSASLGIEISDFSIKMTKVLFQNKKKPTIQTFLTEELPPHVVEEGRIIEPLKVIQTLQKMLDRLDSIPKHIHIVIPSQLVMVRFLKLPDIPLKDLSKLVDFEIKHNIHLPFETPLYDYVKLNGSESKPKTKNLKTSKKLPLPYSKEAMLQAAAAEESPLSFESNNNLFGELEADKDETREALQCDVMLVAAPKELIEEYKVILGASGAKLASIEIKAFSLYRLLQSTALMDTMETFLVVDINASASDLSIFQGDQLKITRSVPLNFHPNPTPHPVQQTTSSLDQLFAEFTDQNTDADSEFRNACNDLAHELERLMNFYRYTLNNRNQEFDVVIVSGDASRLSEIIESLQNRLTLPVHMLTAGQLYNYNQGFLDNFPALAVSLGLALRGKEA